MPGVISNLVNFSINTRHMWVEEVTDVVKILFFFLRLIQLFFVFSFLGGPMTNQVPLSFHLHAPFFWRLDDGQLDQGGEKL